MFTVPRSRVAEGERLFASLTDWVRRTHFHRGHLALARYGVFKGAARRSGVDPKSRKTRRTRYVLSQAYARAAGLADHDKSMPQGWTDYNKFITWASKVRVTALRSGRVLQWLDNPAAHTTPGKSFAVVMAFTAKAKRVAEGDKLWASHTRWLAKHHATTGDHALLYYSVSRGKERAHPLARRAYPDKYSVFVITAVFASQAGLDDYFQQMKTSWGDFKAFTHWAHRGKIAGLQGATVTHALWK